MPVLVRYHCNLIFLNKYKFEKLQQFVIFHGETNARLSWICVPDLPPLSNSVSSGSIPKPFGVGLVPTWKKKFFVSEISADPQKRPYGVKRASSRVKNDQNFLVKIYIKFIISWNRDQKSRACISEDSLGPKVMIPSILGSAEISDTKIFFFQVGTKPTPNGLGMLPELTEIDRGGRSGTQIQDSLALVSPCHIWLLGQWTIFQNEKSLFSPNLTFMLC